MYRTRAARRYALRFLPLMGVYMVLLVAAHLLLERLRPGGPLLYLLAVLPALPLVGVVWVLGQYIAEEQDEYVRMLAVRSMLIATGVLLAAASMWGFLEAFAGLPHVPAFYAFPLWAGALGVATCLRKLRP